MFPFRVARPLRIRWFTLGSFLSDVQVNFLMPIKAVPSIFDHVTTRSVRVRVECLTAPELDVQSAIDTLRRRVVRVSCEYVRVDGGVLCEYAATSMRCDRDIVNEVTDSDNAPCCPNK